LLPESGAIGSRSSPKPTEDRLGLLRLIVFLGVYRIQAPLLRMATGFDDNLLWAATFQILDQLVAVLIFPLSSSSVGNDFAEPTGGVVGGGAPFEGAGPVSVGGLSENRP